MASKTTTRKVTYLGRRAEVTEIRTGGPTSEREVQTRWIDDAHERNGGYPAGTVTSRTITGNFTKGTGVVLVETHVIGA